MSSKDYVRRESAETWPWILPDEMIEIQIDAYSHMPVGPNGDVRLDVFWAALKEKMFSINEELLCAKTVDAVTAAEARLKLMRVEQERVLSSMQRIAMEVLRLEYYIGYGFRDTRGIRTIILPSEWPLAEMDWDKGVVTIDTRRYTDVRFLCYQFLPMEIKYAINRELRAGGYFVPHGPGEAMEQGESPSDTRFPDDTPPSPSSFMDPKRQPRDKQYTTARNDQWRARCQEIKNAEPARTTKEIAAQITNEYEQKTGIRLGTTTVEREIRGIKSVVH